MTTWTKQNSENLDWSKLNAILLIIDNWDYILSTIENNIILELGLNFEWDYLYIGIEGYIHLLESNNSLEWAKENPVSVTWI